MASYDYKTEASTGFLHSTEVILFLCYSLKTVRIVVVILDTSCTVSHYLEKQTRVLLLETRITVMVKVRLIFLLL